MSVKPIGYSPSNTPANVDLDVLAANAANALGAAAQAEVAAAAALAAVTGAVPGDGRTVTDLPTYLADNAVFNVKDYGAVGDGVTDDTAAIQRAIDHSTASTTAPITGVAGVEIVGGAIVYFPASATGYKINTALKVTNSKVTFRGPALIKCAAGIVAFQFTYAGSHNHSGIVFDGIDISAGAIGINVGTNTMPVPILIQNCKFVSQTTAGIVMGNNGFRSSIRNCVFGGCAIGVDNNGASTDGLVITGCVFYYCGTYSIRVVTANNFTISDNTFITIGTTAADIYINLTTQYTGEASYIRNNKFGPENRVSGNMIKVESTGTGNQALNLNITDNFLGYMNDLAGNPTSFAIAFIGVPMTNCVIRGNWCLYCQLLDTSAALNSSLGGDNFIEGNVFYPYGWDERARANFRVRSLPEPTRIQNLVDRSRAFDGTGLALTALTPSYMTAVDENGVANNASTFVATAVGNNFRVSINGSDNNFTLGKRYTMVVNLKLSVNGQVSFLVSRGASVVVAKSLNLSAGVWERAAFDCYELVETNGYLLEMTIPNGATMTLGNYSLVEGRDVGDLFNYRIGPAPHSVSQLVTKDFESEDMPTVGHFVLGTRVWNITPTQVNGYTLLGWLRLTTGSAHVLNTDWSLIRALTGQAGGGAGGGNVATTGSALGSYGYTQAQADAIPVLLNKVYQALVTLGYMS